MTVFIAAAAFCDVSAAQSRRTLNAPPAPSEQQIKERVNAGTVGLAGGLLEGAPIRFATEIARVVNESNQVHVLPIVTRGPTENVNDLLYLKGVDLAIINTNSLEEYKIRKFPATACLDHDSWPTPSPGGPLSDSTIVPSGVVQLMEKQEKGWSYVRP